jgi:hypothetical protein
MLTVLLTAMMILTPICVDNYETLIKERAPRPVVVAVLTGNAVQRVEAFTYLQQTKRLTGDAIRWERASIAVQVAIARHPFKEPGDLVDYITGAAAFVDTPVLRLQVVPRITLVETVNRYLLAKSPDDRRMYGELLYAVSENRANSCSFWR